MATLAEIKAALLDTIKRLSEQGVTQFVEGKDSARFSEVTALLRALEMTADPDVVAAANSSGTETVTTFQPVE